MRSHVLEFLNVYNIAVFHSSGLFVLYMLFQLVPVGICVLEEQLISQDADERPSKRGRSDAALVSTDTPSWIELARYMCTSVFCSAQILPGTC